MNLDTVDLDQDPEPDRPVLTLFTYEHLPQGLLYDICEELAGAGALISLGLRPGPVRTLALNQLLIARQMVISAYHLDRAAKRAEDKPKEDPPMPSIPPVPAS